MGISWENLPKISESEIYGVHLLFYFFSLNVSFSNVFYLSKLLCNFHPSLNLGWALNIENFDIETGG